MFTAKMQGCLKRKKIFFELKRWDEDKMPEKCAPVAPAAGSLIDLGPGDFSAS